MATYSVKEVEKLTGIKAHTLRIWERRYSFVTPSRTDTNIRFYDDEQIKKLINVGLLVRNGYRVSQIDKMSNDEISDILNSIVIKPDVNDQDIIDAMNICMISYDEKGFTQIIERQILRVGLFSTIVELIYPFLNNVGFLWSASKTTPAQEHFVSNLIRQKIISAVDKISLKSDSTKTIVLFIPEGEKHELGLLLSSYLAKDLGWRVIYLGLNVPFDNIEGVIKDVSPDILFTIITVPNENFKADQVIKIKQMVNLLLYSGFRDKQNYSEEDSKFKYIDSPQSFIDVLKSYE